MISIRFEKEQAKVLKNAAKIGNKNSFGEESVYLEFNKDGITIESANYDVTYQHFIPLSMIDAISEEQPFFLNIRKPDLSDIKGPTEITFDASQYTIRDAYQTVTRQTLSTGRKKTTTEKPSGNPSRVGQAYFASLKNLATAIDRKMTSRPQLWGIIHAGKYVYATDGHRIHTYHHLGWFEHPFIVTDTAIPHLANVFKKASADVLTDGTHVHYYGAKYTDKDNMEYRLLARKVDFGGFNPERLIQFYDYKTEPIFSIEKPKEWAETLTRALKAVKDIQNNMITIETQNNWAIKVEAGAQDQAFGSWLQASVERKYSGRFNARFLRDAIKHVGECNVYEMQYDGTWKPIMMKSVDGERSAIVMPIAVR